jgi:hypothetical protein
MSPHLEDGGKSFAETLDPSNYTTRLYIPDDHVPAVLRPDEHKSLKGMFALSFGNFSNTAV